MKRSIILMACLLAACSGSETTLVSNDGDSVEVVEDEEGERPPGGSSDADSGFGCGLYEGSEVEMTVGDKTYSMDVPVLCDEFYFETGRPPDSEGPVHSEMMSPETEAQGHE